MKNVGMFTLFNGTAVLATENLDSPVFNVRDYPCNGSFAIWVEETGDGTAKYTYQVSWDRINFITPSGASDIVTAFIKATGTSGVDYYRFAPGPAPYLRINVEETGDADDLAPVATLLFD